MQIFQNFKRIKPLLQRCHVTSNCIFFNKLVEKSVCGKFHVFVIRRPFFLATPISGVAGGGVCVVSSLKKEGGPGAVAPGKCFHFLPQTMGFCKISCSRKITKQKNRCRMRD